MAPAPQLITAHPQDPAPDSEWNERLDADSSKEGLPEQGPAEPDEEDPSTTGTHEVIKAGLPKQGPEQAS